ncbi:lambda-crystallin homolog isoform X1 [Conger conger]|uniref:lambda-crystallin homolog isoform X1 n=1 Tax=Conger conger TaxID=82655 RepID=UPI002A598A6F|nr:lambda-crystallin homolog isoform X1 [Conger conger]
MSTVTSEERIISVIGSGLIGRSWAMVFLSGGYRVKIYDNQPGQAMKALQEVRTQLEELQQAQILRGELSAAEQFSLLSSYDDLSQALEGAFFVQECVFEDLEAKQSVFQAVESHVSESVIISSSTSCLLPSNIFSRLQNRKRCIVSHPVNPPYYVRLVELVPHPETTPEVMQRSHALMIRVGQSPARLRKEVDGFALNRVQYAVIAEAWRLVKEGIISVQDIDLVMTEGLGMRYAFIGPMETMHLNAPEGLGDYLKRYREGMRRVLSSFGPVPEFSEEEAKTVVQEMCDLIPNDQQHLSARRERRDQLLMGLAKLKK